jgi:threonine/homoserine/homoserine lactone efflux protein
VLIQQFALLYEILRWLGVAYLLFLAWEGWQTQSESSPGRADLRSTVSPLFLRGFLSNVFNPKSIIFFVSVVPRFVQTEPGALSIPIQMVVLGSLYIGIATTIHATIVMMAAQLKPWFVDGRRRDITRRVLSVALALVAVWLAWTTRR